MENDNVARGIAAALNDDYSCTNCEGRGWHWVHVSGSAYIDSTGQTKWKRKKRTCTVCEGKGSFA